MGIRGSLNYVQEIHVAKQPTDLAPKTVAGATTTPIQDAINLITDNAAGKRYAIIVHPGTYTEKIVLEDYIDLIAAGGREETIITFVATGAGEPTVTGENCMVKGFTIITDSGTATGRCVEAGVADFELVDCVLSIDNHDGNEIVLNASADFEMRDCTVDAAGEGATGVNLTTDGTTYVIYQCVINSGTNGLALSANTITLNINDSQLSAITDINGATLVTAHRCYFVNVDCDGGNINFNECGIDTIAADGATLVASGGRVHACTSSTGTSFVWWQTSDELVIMPNMVIAHALTAAAGGGIVILIRPGTYTESNLTLVASVNLVGTDPEQCIISASVATPILNCGVTCAISNLTVTNGDAGGTAITVTANTLTTRNCNINGFGAGDAIAMTAGVLNAYDCQVGAGDIDLSTAICTLSMYRSRITTDSIDTAGNFAHVLTFEQCDLGNQNLASAAIGATTLTMSGCSHVGQVSNAGSGNFTIRDSDVGDVTTTSTGFITVFGGDVGTCAAAAAGGDIVWWKDTNLIYIMPAMHIEHALTAAGLATGDTIELGHGTWAESNLIAINGVDIIGQGRDISIISTGDATNAIIEVGNDVNITIRNVGIVNTSTANGIDIAAGAANSSVRLEYCSVSNTGGSGNAVTLTTTAAGAPSMEAYDTYFNGTDVNIAVSGAVVATVNVFDCGFATGAVATFTGADHTFDAVNCGGGGGAVTVAANNSVINLTRCNDVGAITNAGTGAMTFEHCTTGNITNSSTGTTTIEHCNCGILAQGAAAGTINAYNSYLTEAECGADVGAAINLYLCDIVDIDSDGGTTTVYGGNIRGVSGNTGAIVWWKDPNLLYVLNSTVDMKIADALTATGLAAGDIIKVGAGTFAESGLTAIDGVDIIGQGRDISIIKATDNTDPIIDVGNSVNITLRNIGIENEGTANGIDIAAGAAASHVRLEYCSVSNTGGSGDAVTLTTTAAGAPSLVAYDTYFNGTDTNIAVSGAVVANVDVYDCQFATGALATFTGAAHTFDAVNCDCAGLAVTVTADDGVISMTHCNDVGAITNLAGALTLEHCTTGAITNTTGTTIIEHCNTGSFTSTGAATVTITTSTLGAVEQGAAAGTITITNSSMGAITTGAGGTIRLNGGCYFTDITANAGVLTWQRDQSHLKVVAGTANMKLADALTLAGAGDTIEVGKGTFAESALTAENDLDIVGLGHDISIIEATDAGNPIITVGTGVSCVFRGLKISNLGADPAIAVTAGAAAAGLTVRDCLLKSDGANSIVAVTGSATMAATFDASLTAFDTGADAITVTGVTACTVTVNQSVFITCTLAFSATGANHSFTLDDCDFATAGVTLSANVPVVNLTKCNDIGTFTHSTASTVTLNNCYVSGAYTTAAVAAIVNAFQCSFGNTFTHAGTGAVDFDHCDMVAVNNNSTASMSMTHCSAGAVTQAAVAGTITVTNSSMGDITTGADGTIRLNGGCSFSDIAANAGILTWKIDPNHIKVVAGTANMKIANALTLAGVGDVIEIYPGTYAVANLTLVASVNLVGTDRDQCLIVADSTTNPVINSAVTCTLSKLTIGGTNAANPAIAITANILTVRDCYIYGTGVGDAVTMVAGQLDAYNSTVGAGDIDLSTDTCTLNMYFCRITTDPINTAAAAVAHVLNFEQCDLGGQSIVSAATIGTTLDMDGCTSVGTVSNAGTGAFTINASEVGTVTASLNGTIAVVGGYLGACGGATASVTWQTGALRYEVLVNMRIQDSLTAGAGGEVIIHAGTHVPPNPAAPGVALTVSGNTMVRGEGFASIIQGAAGATNITQLMQLNGNNIHIKDMKLILGAGCGTAGAYPNVLYATGVQQLWLENLWLVGDTSVADDGVDTRQCGIYFTNVDDSKIMGCRIEDCDRHGIHLNNASDYNTVSDNTSQGNTQIGILLTGSLHNTIKGNTTYGNTTYGIKLGTSDNNTITGNTVQGNGQYGMEINASDENTITGNTVQGNTSHGIWIGVSTNNTVTGNTIVDNNSGGAAGSGIYVLTSDGTVITGNQCNANGLHGIYIWRSSYCTVTGNGCHNQNTGDGINVTGDGTTNADFNTLTGNVCTGNASNGIEIVGAGDANENIVVANNLKNNTGANLADAGILTQIGHNIV